MLFDSGMKHGMCSPAETLLLPRIAKLPLYTVIHGLRKAMTFGDTRVSNPVTLNPYRP